MWENRSWSVTCKYFNTFKPGAGLAQSGRWLVCGLDDQGIDIVVHWPAGRRDFPLLQNSKTGYGATPASYSTGAEAVCLGVKRPCREANPSNEVKSDRRCTSSPIICLRVVVHRDSSACLFVAWLPSVINSFRPSTAIIALFLHILSSHPSVTILTDVGGA